MSVYTIPPTVSFVDAFAAGLYDEAASDPLILSRITVLVPNRRAGRSLREAFLRLSDGKPLLLPIIRPIGDVEEDELWLGTEGGPDSDIPPAIHPLRRQLILSRYLLSAFPGQYTTEQALAMASALGRFLDSVHTEGLNLDRLDGLVAEQFASHWQITLKFLKDVLRAFWPQQLEAEGCIDPGLRRRLMIEAYTKRLREHPPETPIIAAGSTGSIPATADLLKVIASLRTGRVVLPGLDTLIEDDAWNKIEDGHPQATLRRLLIHLEVSRSQITLWPYTGQRDDKYDPIRNDQRHSLISETMRPAETVGAWANTTAIDARAFENLWLIEADNLDEEAGAIAMLMRQHAEDRETRCQCVLVTPDRILGGRVTALLKRWNISIDDSAGVPLASTPVGEWLLLLGETLHNGLAPISLLACLKHALAAGGSNWPAAAGPFRDFVRDLDRHILRGVRPTPGFEGLNRRLLELKENHPCFASLGAGIGALEKIFQPVIDQNACLDGIIILAETLAGTPEISGADRIWSGEAGEAAANLFATLFEQSDVTPNLEWQTCSDVLRAAMQGVTVRPRYGTHPRLAILGPIEARLYQADTMILGGLNENTWPKLSEVDGWMSRPMRRDFGLPSPERSITLTAHDFAQGLGARNVYLTRSKNREGAPQIPSRWLQRLNTVAMAVGAPDMTKTPDPWREWARMIDEPGEPAKPLPRPIPQPPLDVRPNTLSVTEIGPWRRDPYFIYARHILRLHALDAIDAEPDAATRGTLVHAALERFARTYPNQLPDDAERKLLEIGREVFAEAGDHPDIIGHWWPRFVRMAHSLVAYEKGWRACTEKIMTEARGTMAIETKSGTFTLKGRADRIEKRQNNQWSITDYKTGSIPSIASVKNGDEPQLTLLGAMLLNGSFDQSLGIENSPEQLETLSYWRVAGAEDFLKTVVLENDEDTSLSDECNAALQGLKAMLKAWMEDGAPYIAWPDPSNTLPPGYEYAHLERIAEWTSGEDGDGE